VPSLSLREDAFCSFPLSVSFPKIDFQFLTENNPLLIVEYVVLKTQYSLVYVLFVDSLCLAIDTRILNVDFPRVLYFDYILSVQDF
jgi:hypothetical protein